MAEHKLVVTLERGPLGPEDDGRCSPPELGYHLEHKYYDFVTGGLMFGCGVVGLTVAARSAWERFSFHKDVLSPSGGRNSG
jgi:hypothetical protein